MEDILVECPHCKKSREEILKRVKRFNAHVARCNENPNKSKFYDTEEYREKQRIIRIERGCTMSAESLSRASERQIQKFNAPGFREKFSARMKEAVSSHPESYSKNNVSGRVRNITYEGYTFKGNWELLFGKMLIENNILFEQPSKPFSYMWNNKWHLYFPDFYLPEYDTYIEVKGYERERDKCKWGSVENLKVIRRREIDKIKSKMFDLMEFLNE